MPIYESKTATVIRRSTMHCNAFEKKNIIIFTLSFAFLLASPSRHLNAMPPRVVRPPDPIIASFSFTAGHQPDEEGNFEVGAYCEIHFDIEMIEIKILHSEEIVFNDELPTFRGKITAGQTLFWRINGRIKKNDEFKGIASVVLSIDYLYPYEAMLSYMEDTEKEARNDLITKYEKAVYMHWLEDRKGKTMNISKPLVVRMELDP